MKFSRQLGPRHTPPIARKNAKNLLRGSLGSLEWCIGPGIEDAATMEAAIIRNPSAGLTPVDVKMVAPSAPRAAQSLWVNHVAKRMVAGFLVFEIDNEELHGPSNPWRSAHALYKVNRNRRSKRDKNLKNLQRILICSKEAELKLVNGVRTGPSEVRDAHSNRPYREHLIFVLEGSRRFDREYDRIRTYRDVVKVIIPSIDE